MSTGDSTRPHGRPRPHGRLRRHQRGPRRPRSRGAGALALFLALAVIGCGGDAGGDEPSTREAPSAASFPAATGSIEDILAGAEPSDLVVAPVGQVFNRGHNRYGFAVFELDQTPVLDAEVAMYFAHERSGELLGPLPARVESMETKPAFAAATTAQDPDAAKAVYVVPRVRFDRPGEWVGVALIRTGEGSFESTRLPSAVVGRFGDIPAIGEPALPVNTPTPASVGGDLTKIDTRVPPTDMHTNLASVLGRKPVALLFATPQLCHSRVCGPVVDVQAQVQAELGDAAEFIHMEIYERNDPGEGLRPQVRRYGLPSEPWLFVIDADGVIRERIEGAFGLDELRRAVRAVTPGAAPGADSDSPGA